MKAKGKPTKKKPAKKRPSRKQQSKKTSPQKQRLQDELVRLLPEVEEEGLIFLLKQAQVLIHNLQVDRINREVEELEQTQQSTTRAAPSRAARGAAVVDIEEAANGKSFYLVFPDTRKILGLEEMRLLVRACYEPKRKSEALNRMYRWMQRERRDILSDGKIGSNSSRLLEAIFHRIREKYTLKE